MRPLRLAGHLWLRLSAQAYNLPTDFDRLGQVRSGDDELVARLADLTLSSSRPRARFALARRRLLFGLAAALTVAGSAAAWHGAAVLRSAQPSRVSGEEDALRDSAVFSIVATEWPEVRARLVARIATHDAR